MWETVGILLENNALAGALLLLIVGILSFVRSMIVKYLPIGLEWYRKHVLALEKQNDEMESVRLVRTRLEERIDTLTALIDKMTIAVENCERTK